ncbi:MAG TPA: hypothetical protein VKU41_11380 [Polyangiaceae bacterium]|nr:hypothetical protein [Polyangiaceae bacterium]
MSQFTTARVVSHKFFEIELRPDGIVWLKRSDTPYETIADVHTAYNQFLVLVDNWLLERRILSGELGTRRRTNVAWLYDVRFAPSHRNDPEFEKAIQTRRVDLLERSPLLVVLVKTAAGVMQLRRLGVSGKGQVRTSNDFDEAIHWLLEQLAVLGQPAAPG